MTDYREFLKEHQVMLAPMAGVSDAAMRQLCIEHGAQLTFTEMVSAKGLSYANERTARLIELAPNEAQVGVQLFGHEADVMAEQARWVVEQLGARIAVIDINMGCPARKIVSKGDGASLMQRPEEARAIIAAMSAAVDVPVTVKMRRGYDLDDETAPDFAEMAQQAGAAAVTVHGRFAKQYYQGEASWDVIARVKERVDIPVVGNGDIKRPEDACAMLARTGCDAVMVARAAEGNPWIFGQIVAALDGRSVPDDPTAFERVEEARRHAHLLAQDSPKALMRMRKHASWYCKGLPGASVARGTLNTCKTLADFDEVFDALEQRLRDDDAHGLETKGER